MAPLRWRNTISPIRANATTIATTTTQREGPLGAPRSGDRRELGSSWERIGSAMSNSSCHALKKVSRHSVDVKSLCLQRNHSVYFVCAEALDRDDRDSSP